MDDSGFEQLLGAIRGGQALFITGAGVSAASGIPTFRGSDPDAIWSRDVTELGTLDFFQRQPHQSWSWYLGRFDGLRAAAPNPAHHALAEIEGRLPSTMLLTQNVDGLHLDAGSTNLVEFHGSARKVRCTNRNCEFGPPRGWLPWDEAQLAEFRANPVRTKVPRCPTCRKFLRPHVLWFDEYYTGHEDYGFAVGKRWFHDAAAFVFAGTSFSVGITDLAVRTAQTRGAALFVIDPRAPSFPCVHFSDPAETLLPRLAGAVG